jgi:uncharacterized protein (DUF885 family)
MRSISHALVALTLCSCASAAPRGGGAIATRAVAGADMREFIERWRVDRDTLQRAWPVEHSPRRAESLAKFTHERLDALNALDFDALDQEGRVDWILMKSELDTALRQADLESARSAEIASLVPFAAEITALEDARQAMQPLDVERAAEQLDGLKKQVADARAAAKAAADKTSKSLAKRAAERCDELLHALGDWYGFGKGYDPRFDWWVSKPYDELHAALADYAAYLRRDLAGVASGDETTIIGDPIGRDALLLELKSAFIPYTPEELVAIAESEFKWCEAEMLKASREMGCGDDWKRALEQVKNDHVEPGQQPALILKLANEATEFVEKRELVTVPELAKQSWRMEMMSPQRQLVNPFFTGGETISVSFPTESMTQEQKRMGMRGNNIHFAHATVFHELIPGHHLQGFMNARYRTYRAPFSTPFWLEGWALWWEMLMWDQGFQQTPQDRVGALFWRMHRCARIEFSLGFQLGTMTPQQCIDMLVERVGHERDNAAAEVRRSCNGSYSPLYQCAYMLGALQFRALHHELVDAGKLTNRQFHDAILQGGNMPIELVRARLENAELKRDFATSWRFYDLAR